jgi:hypothetical protein
MQRYLTKSRFKLALECETKLFYAGKKKEYADQSLDDAFLTALAEGGFQVGELAKYYACNDPLKADITIKELNREVALKLTEGKLEDGSKILAEAAFSFENLFIRTDIFQIFPDEKTINFYEVKAKSFDDKVTFCNYIKQTGVIADIVTKWKPYLYDVAFQKYVLSKIYPSYKINAYLTLINKDAIATVDNMNQLFQLRKIYKIVKIDTKEGLKGDQLGAKLLTDVLVNDEVDWILAHPVPTKIKTPISFADYVVLISNQYNADIKIVTPIGKKCKDCQFRTTAKDQISGSIKSGFKECWLHATGLNESELQKPLVTDLWCGGFNGMQKIIDSGLYLLEAVTEEILIPKKESNTVYPGLTPLERRMLQIEKVRNNDEKVYLDKTGLKKEMESWNFPLHFIDFETSRVAVPFHAGRRPYEQIAFQFSHHMVQKDYSIRHAGEYISYEPGVFPNYDFLRALKSELENDNGTIFRYHNHENNVLNDIYNQLGQDQSTIEDRDELMKFIKSITHRTKKAKEEGEEWKGERDMVDMYKLITSYYYPPAAGGSNSLKYILPATIRTSVFLQNKYSQPVYGSETMTSKNFKDKIWFPTTDQFNPYKELPPVFEDVDEDQLDALIESVDEIAQGGAAMTAYAKLQFENMPSEQREMLRDALLKYCELDTLAMVMIWEYWLNDLKTMI